MRAYFVWQRVKCPHIDLQATEDQICTCGALPTMFLRGALPRRGAFSLSRKREFTRLGQRREPARRVILPTISDPFRASAASMSTGGDVRLAIGAAGISGDPKSFVPLVSIVLRDVFLLHLGLPFDIGPQWLSFKGKPYASSSD